MPLRDLVVQGAREQWRAVTGAGLAAVYWAQEGGRWVKKHESAAARPGSEAN